MKYATTGDSLKKHYVQKIMNENPGMKHYEAYQVYIDMMRERGRKGGINTKSRPFRDIPGLAQRAAKLSKPYTKNGKNR